MIHCWSGPRSLSTCFLYSFAMRPDCTALDEPLYPHYLTTYSELYRPYREELLSTSITDGNEVLRQINSKESSEKPLVFAKHIGKFLVNLDRSLLYNADALYILLVRDPLDMILSWSHNEDVHREECSLENTCLPQLVQVFSEVKRLTGKCPVIIDVELLQEYPEPILRELCCRLKIPFCSEQLSWPAGPKPGLDGIWAPFWYEEVHKSTGFAKKAGRDQVRSYPALSPAQLAVYREAIPFYQILKRHAIGHSPLNPGSSTYLPNYSDLSPGLGPLVSFTDPRNLDILAWVGDSLVPREHAKVSVFDSAVQGGDACWEGLRVYKGRIFALRAHLKRLAHSAKSLKFEGIPSEEYIRRAIKKTLDVNGMHDGVHIRLTLTRGAKISSSMNPNFNLFGTNLIVLPEWKAVCGPTTYDNSSGIVLVTSSTRRNSPQSIDSKIHHNNLINNILAKIDANNAGAADAIMLDTDGFVAETNATNLFLVKNGELLTPSADFCLPGCTREIVIQIARELGIPVTERRISLTEFYTADEVFTTGTMGEITPVKQIDGRKIEGGNIVIRSLQAVYSEKTKILSEDII